MIKQILIPSDVTKYSDIGQFLKGCEFSNSLFQIEMDAILKCFGWDFYDCLKGALNEDFYNAPEWCPQVNQGFVKFENCVYYSEVETEAKPPCAPWVKACRFNECFCEFWEYFLAPYLAAIVVHDNLAKLVVKVDSSGAYMVKNDERVPATKDWIETLATKYGEEILRIHENMIRYLQRERDKKNPCFEKICLPCWHDCPCDCKVQKVEPKHRGSFNIMIGENTNELCEKEKGGCQKW